MIAIKRCALALAVLLTATAAQAEISPDRGAFDARVRVVDYNAQNVVRLTTFYGVSTHVQFADGEVIEDIASGDDTAWKIVPRSGNHLFIKPQATDADTNMTVVTNKRTYQFALIVRSANRMDEKAWRDPNLIFSLSFRYPDDIRAQQLADAAVQQKKADKQTISQRFEQSKLDTADTNFDYWAAGADEAMPTAVKDNGQYMSFQFANNRDVPSFFAEDEHGNEQKLQTTPDGNWIVVHRTWRKVTLRKGEFVACVVNKSFDYNVGKDNTTGTTAPDVKRVIKGEDQ